MGEVLQLNRDDYSAIKDATSNVYPSAAKLFKSSVESFGMTQQEPFACVMGLGCA